MLNKAKNVRVVIEHQRTEKPDSLYNEFHEWLTTNTWIRANANGIPNPRMISPSWLKAVCNNTDCPALAFINVAAVIEQDFPITNCLAPYDETH